MSQLFELRRILVPCLGLGCWLYGARPSFAQSAAPAGPPAAMQPAPAAQAASPSQSLPAQQPNGTRPGSQSAPGNTVAPPSSQAAVATAVEAPPQLQLPSLERVVALAMERAPEVTMGKATVEASRSSLVGARVAPLLNPYLEVVAEQGRGVNRNVAVTGSLFLPLEVAGQRGRRVAEAESFIHWNQATLGRVRARAAGEAVSVFGQLLAVAARLETLQELVQSAGTEAQVLAARRDAGDATERDAQLAAVERARIAVQLEESRAALHAAQGELLRLTGQRFVVPSGTHVFPRLAPRPMQSKDAAPWVQAAEAEASYYARTHERLGRDRVGPVSVILQGGRGDSGETRLGAGLAWELPTFRRLQGERARALSEAARAQVEARVLRAGIEQRLSRISEEYAGLMAAIQVLDREAIPAAQAATESATRMQRAGKTDLLSVVVARRDLYVLRLRRLEIAERNWELLGEWVELTGRLPNQ
ncbi:MAG TPA: TolC family protein [Polyangiaceae bacterium]|nr:TolC family protein [Polyangiaceae bacterium]